MTAPDTLLFIAPGCPHCPGVLDALAKLVKEGVIGRLEVVNVAVHPESAQERGVRGVPWILIGPFELEGAVAPAELRRWAERVDAPDGLSSYVEKTLADGGLARVERLIAQAPGELGRLLPLVEKPDLPMQVRVGLSALFESFAGTAWLAALVPQLGRLTAHPDHRVRSDACHFLGLTASLDAVAVLKTCLTDENAEVREIAQEALAELTHAQG